MRLVGLQPVQDSVAHDLVTVFRSMGYLPDRIPEPVRPVGYAPRKMTEAQREQVLECFAKGMGLTEIRNTVTRSNGQKFYVKHIGAVIAAARNAGDRRAVRRG